MGEAKTVQSVFIVMHQSMGNRGRSVGKAGEWFCHIASSAMDCNMMSTAYVVTSMRVRSVKLKERVYSQAPSNGEV